MSNEGKEEKKLIPDGWIVGSDFESTHHEQIELEIVKRAANLNPAMKSIWFERDFRAGTRFGISLFQAQQLQIKQKLTVEQVVIGLEEKMAECKRKEELLEGKVTEYSKGVKDAYEATLTWIKSRKV